MSEVVAPPAPSTASLCIVVCGNLHREVQRVVEQEQMHDVTVHAFAADCTGPRLGTLHDPLREARRKGDVYLLGGGCLGAQPRLRSVTPHLAVERRSHCQSLLCSATLVEHLMSEGAFVMTSGWVLGWRDYLKRWGAEPAEVRQVLGATSLVLLDSQVDPEAPRELERCATWLGLPWRVLPVGLDHLRLELIRIVDHWRETKQREEVSHQLAAAARRAADQQMLLDMLGSMTKATSVDDAGERAIDVFDLFFPSEDLALIPMVGGHSQPPVLRRGAAPPPRLLVPAGKVVAVGKVGFAASLLYSDEVLGVVVVDGLQFPEFLEAYMQTATLVSRVCALAIATARAHQRMSGSIDNLTASLKTLSGLIPICSHCKNVRTDTGYWEAVESYLIQRSTAEFSHSLCPDCVRTYYPDVADQLLNPEEP